MRSGRVGSPPGRSDRGGRTGALVGSGLVTPARAITTVASMLMRWSRPGRRAEHHVLLRLDSPGAGTSRLARRLTTILPDLTRAEAMETTRIHRVAGLTADRTALVTTQPFRARPHTIADVGLIGGGQGPLPGEVSLAPHGVLFLDELPEFRRHILEVLRQPLEAGSLEAPWPGRPGPQHVGGIRPADDSRAGGAQRSVAFDHDADRGPAASGSPPPPRQPLQPSPAFPLTPGPAWSTDTVSQTPMSMARGEAPARVTQPRARPCRRAHLCAA